MAARRERDVLGALLATARLRPALQSSFPASGALQRGQDALVRLGVALEFWEVRAADLAHGALTFATVLLLGAVLMLTRLGAAEVCNSNEAVEGLVVQQMIERGELLFPVLNASAPMYKPPLFHWTATVLAYLFGIHDVTELTLRLPSVLYGLGGVLLSMMFVRGWLGVPSAVLAGLVLLGSYQYVDEARFGRVDMALTFFEALGLFSFLWWLSARHRERADDSSYAGTRRTLAHYVFALALGLGVLVKGPVGMVLPLAAAVLFLILDRRWDDLRALGAPGPALVSLAVGSSWYVAGYWGQHFDVLERQIVSENFSRFMGGIRTMPPWYYVKPLVLNSVPFSVLVPFAVVRAFRSGGAATRARADAGPARLLAIFWLVTVLFFSIAAYKRRAYLLPVWPPAAVLLVWWLRARPGERLRRLGEGAVAAACAVLMVFNLLYIPRAERAACHGAQYRRAVADIKRVVAPGAALYFHGLGAEPASLLFYLDRTVPILSGTLADAPRGYVLVPEDAWIRNRASATLHAILALTVERHRLVLLESAPRAPSAPG
jgi:4-amino-4-deoxy-L-arabinose transferase-like glycosyltransferase